MDMNEYIMTIMAIASGDGSEAEMLYKHLTNIHHNVTCARKQCFPITRQV